MSELASESLSYQDSMSLFTLHQQSGPLGSRTLSFAVQVRRIPVLLAAHLIIVTQLSVLSTHHRGIEPLTVGFGGQPAPSA